jgi:hypothetical protein
MAGLTNGGPLVEAEHGGFDVLVTVDQNMPSEQNLGARKIAVVVLSPPSNSLRDLVPLIPATLAAVASITPGTVARVS